MAQFQSENSSDPLKVTHGERGESQQQAWPTPSAPAFLTKPTQGADDQHDDKLQEHEVNPSPKKSMLQKVKDRAKTFIHKHGRGHGNDQKEEEEEQNQEEEEDHDHFDQEEKQDNEGKKKENVEDLNSNSNTRSSDEGSAVSPGLDALSTRNLANDAGADREREESNTGIQWPPSDSNVVAGGSEPRAASDIPQSPVETASGQEELHTAPADAGSAVSPKLDALSTRNLSNDSEEATDREVTNTGIQWTSRDPNVAEVGFEPRAASDGPQSPVETAGGHQEFPTAPDQPSAIITPIIQSTEAENTARPYEDAQSDGFSNKYMAAHQVDDTEGTGTPFSSPHVPAIQPVQSEFSQEPYSSGKEAPETELYGKEEPEKLGYSEPFSRAPSDPEEVMKPVITKEPLETVPIEEGAADGWFDADNFVAGAPTVNDQNPSTRHLGSEKFGATEPISNEPEYADQDNVRGTEIKSHSGVSDESQDLKAQEDNSKEYNENAGRSAALYSDGGSKDTTAMGLGAGAGLHANEEEKERKDEEAAGLDESYMEKNNVASKLGNSERKSVDEEPYEPDRVQAKDSDNYGNDEKGKSYGDEIYQTDSTEKNELSSKLEHGEHQEPGQEYGEKRTEMPSEDVKEGAYEKSGIEPSAAESVVSSNHAEAEEDNYGNSGKGKSYGDEIYETDSTEKNEVSSKLEHGEHQEPGQEDGEQRTEMPSEDVKEEAYEKSGVETSAAPESVVSSNHAEAEEDKYGNSEKGKSYGDETDSAEKNGISSKLEYGEHEEPELEEGREKRTERPSEDEKEWAHEENNDAHTPFAAESVVSSNNAVEEKAEDPEEEKTKSESSVVSPNKAVEEKADQGQTDGDGEEEKRKTESGAGKSYGDKMYATANTAKSAFYSTFGFGSPKTAKENE